MYGIRTHANGFTNRGANPYTNFTIVLVEVLGLEPRMTESKSVVLPLHHTSIVLANPQGVEPRPRVLETRVLP